jgi:hypothetical protein
MLETSRAFDRRCAGAWRGTARCGRRRATPGSIGELDAQRTLRILCSGDALLRTRRVGDLEHVGLSLVVADLEAIQDERVDPSATQLEMGHSAVVVEILQGASVCAVAEAGGVRVRAGAGQPSARVVLEEVPLAGGELACDG